MKIVIDIDKEKYEYIKKYLNEEFLVIGWREIINGTPLPEGAEILTKEAYSDLCMRAADVPNFESKEYVEERIKNYDIMLKSGILDCVIEKSQESDGNG